MCYKSLYFRLFGQMSDAINRIDHILSSPELSVELTRQLGMIAEEMKQAQREAEERYIDG